MFIRLTVWSLRTFVTRACWVPLGRSAKAVMVTAEFHCCFQIWNPSGVQVEMSSFGTRAISEENKLEIWSVCWKRSPETCVQWWFLVLAR